MKNVDTDLKLVCALTILTIIFVLVPGINHGPVRVILGLFMVLFLPGYTLIAALFPAKDDLDGIERFALSVGLSIAVVPLMGLALNFTSFGIRLVPVLVSISIFTLLMVMVAVFRRNALSEGSSFTVPFKEIFNGIKDELFTAPASRTNKILNIVLVISILLSVTMLVYVVVMPKEGEKFTEFYILGPDGMTDDYPTELSMGKEAQIFVGVVNHEYRTVNYTMNIDMRDSTIYNTDMAISHNQTWENPVVFTPTMTGEDIKLQFLLYKDGNMSAPYRSLHLWVNSS